MATRVEETLGSLSHRGPDASDHRSMRLGSATCCLGHTRLRILDLSPNADQPMCNEDATVWVVFNGEIYNFRELRADLEREGHVFKSRTDTEVLVHLYEDARGDARNMLARLRGMFAFAIVDTVRERVLLARDRLGIKPLYYVQGPAGFAFASEVRALAACGLASASPDVSAVAQYVLHGVTTARPIVKDASELSPGSFLLWDNAGAAVQRWWRPTFSTDPELAPEAHWIVESALDDAVTRHLISDRPVGIFLSGGTDSTAVARLVARRGKGRALTVTFPEEQVDEGNAAVATARELGLEHECVPVTGNDVARMWPRFVGAMDQPTHDGVNTWLVCHAAKEAGLVVALSGLGGDEVFGGYKSFRNVPALVRLRQPLLMMPRRVRQALTSSVTHRAPGGRVAKMLGAPAGWWGAYVAQRCLFSHMEVPAPLRSYLPSDGNRFTEENDVFQSAGDRVSSLEIDTYLASQLLRDTDQMSMSHSLEVRVPLLDDVVVQTALALPARTRLASGKSLLASAAGMNSLRPKQPFALPYERWLRGPLRPIVREGLLSDALPFAQLLPYKWRQRLWAAFVDRRTHWSRPWAIVVLRHWPVVNGFTWEGT